MLFKRGEKELPSTARTLRVIVGGEVLDRLVMTTPDRRDLIHTTARELGLTEAALAQKIARRLGLPFLLRVLPMEIAVLPAGMTVSDFRRRGAVAVTSGGMVRGIVCVDPSQVEALRMSYPDSSLYLAAWSSISRALDESERLFLEEQQRQAVEQAAGERRLAESVLQLVLQEARGRGANSIAISLNSGNVRYSFELCGDRRAVGSIDGRAAEGLEALLSEYAHESATGVAPTGLAGMIVSKRSVETGSNYLFFRAVPGSCDKQDVAAIAAPPVQKSEALSALKPARNSKSRAKRSAKRAERHTATDSSSGDIRGGSQSVVLLVDDNAAFTQVLERFLVREGFLIAHASSAKQALGMMESNAVDPALIICDIYMPEMNGIEFIMRVRSSVRYSQRPIIALTSAGEVEMELQVIEQGADAFVCKSEDPRVLCAHVKRLIHRFARVEAA